MKNQLAITLSLVEDNHDFRNQMISMFFDKKNVEVISDFSNYTDALKELSIEQPDVILMDIQLTGAETGIDLVGALRQVNIRSKIIMLTSYDDDDKVFGALKNGANGYLIKGESKEVVVSAIQDVMDGKAPMSSKIASLLIAYFNQLGNETKELNQLTKRENEILKILAGGFLYKEVADQLDISPETVKKHAGSIYRKLHVSNKMEAVNIYNKR